MTDNLMTKAAFARLCGVSKPAVAKWLTQGIAVATSGMIDLAATATSMRQFRKGGMPDGFATLLAAPETVHGVAAEAPSLGSNSCTTMIKRSDLVERLLRLDWQASGPIDGAGLRSRATVAAAAVGFELVESDQKDDGHWGGYQLRSLAALAREGGICFDAIVAGYGYELDAWDVLRECREVMSHPDDDEGDGEDLIAFDLELLPALAYPFGPHHRPPEASAGDLR